MPKCAGRTLFWFDQLGQLARIRRRHVVIRTMYHVCSSISTIVLSCCMQMLAACSNPDSVMRQQLAFDQQDSKASGRSTAGRYLGSRGGASSRGFMSGKGQRACSKPRKGWMALF